MTPYAKVLGGTLSSQACELQIFHSTHGTFKGEMTVEGARNWVLRALGRLAGFPPSGTFPLTLDKSPNQRGERWTRNIGPRIMTSQQWVEDDLLAERLGPLTALSAIDRAHDGLRLRPKAWRVLGMPMPRALAPKIQTHENSDHMHYCFDVRIALPVFNIQIMRYHGHLDTHLAALSKTP